MVRSLRVRVGLILAGFIALSLVVWAQVESPTQVHFQCSPDQATLSRYEVRSVVVETSVASEPVSAGLPPPVDGVCTVSIDTSGWSPDVPYRVEVRSVRGTAVSAWVPTARTGVVTAAEPPPADANTYYVATTGSDANSCVTARTITTPKRTLNNAMTCLSSGSTLLVRSGTYTESLINTVPSGTSWSATVHIAAYPGETVWMRPTSGSFVIHLQGTSQYIDFDGINIDGDGVISNAVKIESFVGVARHNPNHIRIQNAEIMGASTTADTAQSRVGILVTNVNGIATGGHEFKNLTFHRIRSKYTGTANQGSLGLYLQSGNNLVEDCEFYDFRFGAFQIYNAYGYKGNNNIIRRNKIHDPTSVSGAAHVGMVVYSTTSGTQIYNNLIYNIQSNGANTKGVEYSSSASGVSFSFNTIYNVAGIGLAVQGSSNTVRNVIAYGNSTNTSLAAGTTQSNNLFGTNPLFTSASNFHLLVGSPAIGAGVAVGGISTDYDGVARGTPPDIGAYEYVP